MTTTARQITRRIATDTAAIAGLVTFGIFDTEFETCELNGCTAAELFTRTDNRDGAEIRVCEWCADHGDVSCTDEYDV